MIATWEHLGSFYPSLDAAECIFQTASAARDEFLVTQMPLVHRIARSLYKKLPKSVDIDDLISAGTIGLIEALSRFDPERNVDFGAYARIRIRGAMVDSLRAMDWRPRHLRDKAQLVQKSSRALTARLGRIPDTEEISEEAGIPLDELHKLADDLNRLDIDTLNVACSESVDIERIECVPCGQEFNPLEQCMNSEMRDLLDASIAQLSERERQVIVLHYFKEITLEEIAFSLGLSASRITQIRMAAIKQLRTKLQSSPGLRAYIGARRGAETIRWPAWANHRSRTAAQVQSQAAA